MGAGMLAAEGRGEGSVEGHLVAPIRELPPYGILLGYLLKETAIASILLETTAKPLYQRMGVKPVEIAIGGIGSYQLADQLPNPLWG